MLMHSCWNQKVIFHVDSIFLMLKNKNIHNNYNLLLLFIMLLFVVLIL